LKKEISPRKQKKTNETSATPGERWLEEHYAQNRPQVCPDF
jgi:hypothetical protein